MVLFDQFDGLSCEFLENVDFGAVGVEEGVGIVRWVFQLLDHSYRSFVYFKSLFLSQVLTSIAIRCANIYFLQHKGPHPNRDGAHYISIRHTCRRTR